MRSSTRWIPLVAEGHLACRRVPDRSRPADGLECTLPARASRTRSPGRVVRSSVVCAPASPLHVQTGPPTREQGGPVMRHRPVSRVLSGVDTRTVIPLGVRSPAFSSSLPAASWSRWAPLAAYLALLQPGFTVPRLLPDTRWALTPPFHPYQPELAGGLFSVALSVTPEDVPRRYLAACPWSPDFPRWPKPSRPSGRCCAPLSR